MMWAESNDTIPTIGLVDWGIGGLSVYKQLLKKNIKANYFYVSDSGYTPYGKCTEEKLIKRLNTIFKFFKNNKIYTVIIACNAASTILTKIKILNPDLNIYGMLNPGLHLILKQKNIKSVLVLGGLRTVQSQFFQRKLKNKTFKLDVISAQPLSALIEKGLHKKSIFKKELLNIKRHINYKPSVILLACTHYPAASKNFKKIFPNSKILDPAKKLSEDLKNDIFFKSTLVPSKKTSSKRNFKLKSNLIFFTSGSKKQSQLSAEKAFDIRINSIQKLPV